MQNQYQSLVRSRYPGVVVRESTLIPASAEGVILDAYCVPDGEGREFLRFVREGLPKLLAESGLPPAIIIPHSESATRSHYPEIAAKTSSDLLETMEFRVSIGPHGWPDVVICEGSTVYAVGVKAHGKGTAVARVTVEANVVAEVLETNGEWSPPPRSRRRRNTAVAPGTPEELRLAA